MVRSRAPGYVDSLLVLGSSAGMMALNRVHEQAVRAGHLGAGIAPPFPTPFPHAARREGEPARCFSSFPPRGGRAGDGGDKHVHNLFVDPAESAQ